MSDEDHQAELRKRQIVGLNASALHPTSSYNNCKAE
jgi:hypothetical protein